MCKTNSWNKESSITGPKDMMTLTQKKQRKKCQGRQLEEIEGYSVSVSVNTDIYISDSIIRKVSNADKPGIYGVIVSSSLKLPELSAFSFSF